MVGRKRRGRGGIEIEDLGQASLSAEQISTAEATVKAADEADDACRVNFRWGRSQLDLVKAVADHIGIPYQTYLKQVVFKQALQDAQAINAQKALATKLDVPKFLKQYAETKSALQSLEMRLAVREETVEFTREDKRKLRSASKAMTECKRIRPGVYEVPEPLVHEIRQFLKVQLEER